MSENINAAAVSGVSTTGNNNRRSVRRAEIEALEASLAESLSDAPKKPKSISTDMYRDEDNNLTHYYKNISTTDIN